MAARRIYAWVAIAGLASVTLAAVAVPARADAGGASPAGQVDRFPLLADYVERQREFVSFEPGHDYRYRTHVERWSVLGVCRHPVSRGGAGATSAKACGTPPFGSTMACPAGGSHAQTGGQYWVQFFGHA